VVEPSEAQLRQASPLEVLRLLIAHGKDQSDWFRVKPARCESQRVCGGFIEPVGVINQTEERRNLRRDG
jgi:hypothetical protein